MRRGLQLLLLGHDDDNVILVVRFHGLHHNDFRVSVAVLAIAIGVTVYRPAYETIIRSVSQRRAATTYKQGRLLLRGKKLQRLRS